MTKVLRNDYVEGMVLRYPTRNNGVAIVISFRECNGMLRTFGQDGIECRSHVGNFVEHEIIYDPRDPKVNSENPTSMYKDRVRVPYDDYVTGMVLILKCGGDQPFTLKERYGDIVFVTSTDTDIIRLSIQRLQDSFVCIFDPRCPDKYSYSNPLELFTYEYV